MERLACNAAQIKNWTITILAVLLLFSRYATEGTDRAYVCPFMLILTLVFWCPDGYYLNSRVPVPPTHDKICQFDPDQVDYTMDTSEFQPRGLGYRIRCSPRYPWGCSI